MHEAATLLNLDQLRDYKNWSGKSPVDIRDSVLKVGGWDKVFPLEVEVKLRGGIKPFDFAAKAKFPEWASRVRNYFNVTPITLKLLSESQGASRTSKIKGKLNTWMPGAHTVALSGDVYLDEYQRPWFEMSTGGTVYHYEGDPNTRKVIGAFLSSQATIPVFKLISPDDTGGSMELCVHNPQVNKVDTPFLGREVSIGKRKIGEEGVVTPVVDKIVTHEVYRGSYNYAETVVRGFDEHDYRDIVPHSEKPGFYVNPENPYLPLDSRRFPRTL